ncbi:hypothetical protein DSO57_1009603 [Entomophthora muscae]|uniref:Uncharacterized protein n=1 Tax=Entomophthora muscae TaxID=34485 RepID=A0ACC2SJU1_9FUNG|nr:hypothetical protein DSO57_1009603 [Entomophthora muscae]
MHSVIRLLRYILYNLILNQITSGRWGPASGILLLAPPNVNFMPANFVAPSPILETENFVPSQCPEFYAEDALMLSQVIYLGLLLLGLLVLLNPGVTIGNFTKKYLKPPWWLIISSMWIWVSQTKEIIAPNGGLITAPNGGTDLATISFINLKSTPAANQELTQERGTGPQPGPMTSTLKQDNHAAKLRFLTNERTSGLSAILPPLDQSTQFPQPWPSQYPDEPPIENVKFGGGLIQLLPCFVFAVYQFSLRSPGLPAPLPAVFYPPGVPFRPIHFTNYPLKSDARNIPWKKILKLNPLAHIQSAVRYNQQGPWIFSTPKLFRGKFNYLPAYNLSMEPPVTPKPMPASLPNLPANHSGKLFWIVYTLLTGVIDTIIPAAGLWSWVEKLASYLLKLAPLLWWALPTKNPAQVTPENNGPATQDWIPDTCIFAY